MGWVHISSETKASELGNKWWREREKDLEQTALSLKGMENPPKRRDDASCRQNKTKKKKRKKNVGRKRALECFLSEKMVDFHLFRRRKAPCACFQTQQHYPLLLDLGCGICHSSCCYIYLNGKEPSVPLWYHAAIRC